MGIFSSKTSSAEEYEEYEHKYWSAAVPSERQASGSPVLNTSLVSTLATVGAAFVAANIGMALLGVVGPHRPTLENDWMCGTTEGGEVPYHCFDSVVTQQLILGGVLFQLCKSI